MIHLFRTKSISRQTVAWEIRDWGGESEKSLKIKCKCEGEKETSLELSVAFLRR